MKKVREHLNENIDDEANIPMYLAKFEKMCQEAANDGLEFEVLQDVINQAMAEVDWDYAARKVEQRYYRNHDGDDD